MTDSKQFGPDMCFEIRQLLKFLVFASVLVGWNPIINGQLIVAHRGASHDAPENTLAAFNLAWEQGADGIEGDFYLSSDGEIVCIHDKTTERTAGVNLEVKKSTLSELKKLDVGRWKDKKFAGQQIPTLAEVLATVPAGKRMIIELKVGPEIVRPLDRVLKSAKFKPEQVLVIAFDAKTVAESKRVMPHIKAHWLTGYNAKQDFGPWSPSSKDVIRTMRQINADGLGSQARRNVFDDKFIGLLKTAGIHEFHVWTIDNPADARYYKSLGAYGITTNRPAFIRRQLEAKK